MKATSINNHEYDFFKNNRDSDGKQFDVKLKAKRIKGTKEKIEFYHCTINQNYKKKNPDKINDYYVKPKSTVPKKQIVLHFTAGYLKGDLAELTRGAKIETDGKITTPYRLSVPFIIARNGKILNLWDEKKYWAYHLGLSQFNVTCNQQTIGIELSNIGPLEHKGKNLHTIYEDIYCNAKETKFYEKLVQPFRKKNYFATFTDAQYKSLIMLLRYLTKEHDIAPTFLNEKERFTCKKDHLKCLNNSGIASHANYRPYGKWDLGQAFDWARVIEGVKGLSEQVKDNKDEETKNNTTTGINTRPSSGNISTGINKRPSGGNKTTGINTRPSSGNISTGINKRPSGGNKTTGINRRP